jgi:hypothetical protein
LTGVARLEPGPSLTNEEPGRARHGLELKITAPEQDEGIKSQDVLDEWRRTGSI